MRCLGRSVVENSLGIRLASLRCKPSQLHPPSLTPCRYAPHYSGINLVELQRLIHNLLLLGTIAQMDNAPCAGSGQKQRATCRLATVAGTARRHYSLMVADHRQRAGFWLAIKENELAHSSYRGYESKAETHVRPCWSSVQADKIVHIELQSWM